MMVDQYLLESLLKEFLPRQRWFGAKGRVIERVVADRVEAMHGQWPLLLSVESDVSLEGGGQERYQVLLGIRPAGEPPNFLEEGSEALAGEVETLLGPGLAYEALSDPELALMLFRLAFPDLEPPARVRPMSGEMSNTLLVYDESLVFKIFRTLSEKVNLDLEVLEALGKVGFEHVATPLGVWRREDTDLGMVQPFLAGGAEGWALAQTSLRDMFGSRGDPGLTGGDFAAEALRLGATTARMHAALAEAFGTEPADPHGWAEAMRAQLARVQHPSVDRGAAGRIFDRLAETGDAGPSIRVHGDLHLGQVMRTDGGWYVLDFGGEPSRPVVERRRFTSPMKDVAGMLRSLHYACWTALENQAGELLGLVDDWEGRNRGAYFDGYLQTARDLGGSLLPSEESLGLVLKAFELDRGIYEVGYETDHRPDWVHVPLAAISRLY
ncbi:MAG: phosphotransferase [Actinomycetota bacterium]